ncbi:BamA/TamA family outer membrane protein [Paracoccus sp. S-4012]|uniref:autotransporter assembly complex protein TamA n=1 Tax=Paracoccus sp. S-4012 TaxID=2665648 RepID=UPI0012B112B4|nr:autotransporter assembly complex family protein [Paracoccus sp. S-4012]MRX49818.1 BamA/TamA family outer membrane protein [Paracoccus sp. S-4012]
MGRWTNAGLAAVLALGSASLGIAQSTSPFAGLSGLFGNSDPAEGTPVRLDFRIHGDDGELETRLRNASLLTAALRDRRFTGQDLLAAARADYARLLGNLYDEGYYDAVIDITLDGGEAAQVAPLDAPDTISQVIVSVRPGTRFTFSRAGIAPVAPGTDLPEGYRAGEIAGTGVIRDAARSAVTGWRQQGHAKAETGDTDIVADHLRYSVDSRIAMAPGPVVTFGRMHVTGLDRLREKRLREIAGFPERHQFDPDFLEAVRDRLRRSGVFSAVTLEEADALGPGNSMDVALTVVENRPRRIGAGIEASNTDGVALSGYWLHRNLWGGAERFRIDARVSDIGSGTSDSDQSLSFRLDRPATFHRDLTAYLAAGVERLREEDYDSNVAFVRAGVDYYRSDTLSGGVGVEYRYQEVTDDTGTTEFQTVSLPLTGIWDRRDSETDPKQGFWMSAELAPFAGLDTTTGSGVRGVLEGRAYRSFGAEERLTFAGRARLGTVTGPEIIETPRDYLFYSGGGGTVRGQPFESLGVEVIPGPNGPIRTGGMSLAVVNAEARFQVREKIGVVGFADYGKVWEEGGFGGGSGWHAGAGLGVRYLTPIGPIRLDVAGPVGGEPDTGDGVQVYLGIGQAF